MKYSLAIIALLGNYQELTSNCIQLQSNRHHHHHYDDDDYIMEEPATQIAAVEPSGAKPAAAQAADSAKPAAAKDGEKEKLTGPEEAAAKDAQQEADKRDQIAKSERAGQIAITNGKNGQETILKKIEESQGGPAKPVVEKKAEPKFNEDLIKPPVPQVLGNGGEWTMNMPDSIQAGGIGKNHWSEKQKRKDAIEGNNEAVDKAEKKDAAPKEDSKADAKPAGEKKEEAAKPAEAAKADEAAKPDAKAESPPADKEAAEIEAELMTEGDDEKDDDDDDDDDDDEEEEEDGEDDDKEDEKK